MVKSGRLYPRNNNHDQDPETVRNLPAGPKAALLSTQSSGPPITKPSSLRWTVENKNEEDEEEEDLRSSQALLRSRGG